MTQITLGIVPLNLKDKALLGIYRRPLKIVYDKQFQLTREVALQVFHENLDQTIMVYGMILEGSNAIQDWLYITSCLTAETSLFLFASSNLENANHETLWLKNLKVNMRNKIASSSFVSFSSTMSTQKKIRPPTQRTAKANKPIAEKPKETTTTTTSRVSTKNILTTTAKGGVSKPPVSMITGRTRKTSRLTTDKPLKKPVATKPVTTTKSDQQKTKPVTAVKRPTKLAIVDKKVKKTIENKKTEPAPADVTIPVTASVTESSTSTEENNGDTEQQENDVGIVKQQESEVKLEEDQVKKEEEDISDKKDESDIDLEKLTIAEPLQIVSHLSTCSSAATDEHDAEVAATTSKKELIMENTPVLTQSGRSSFSPTASLPRPETPEVDQLRLKFETLSAQPNKEPARKKSAISPEFIARIKDMKPRGPVGSRVKSMVELFMDENLNKWEF